MTLEQLEKSFSVKEGERKSFRRQLSQLESEGLVIKTRWKRYGVPERMNLVVGRLQGHAKGFAFVVPEHADQEDLFIPPADTNGALHNDKVVARRHNKGRGANTEGEVIRVLERNNKTIVGKLEKSKKYGFVIPDDSRLGQDVFVAREDYGGAAHQEKVVVEIIRWPEGRRNAQGRIIQRLGHKDDPGTDILSIIHKHRLPLEFTPKAKEQADNVPDTVSEEDIRGRTDYRDQDVVTIDGADARDLDDAVHVKSHKDGSFTLGVHIADVSHYVRPGSPLDKEAFARGTSVYLVDRVVPMLPERLSNGICSLNPQVDRLTVSLEMDIDTRGDVKSYRLKKGVIRTRERMTYDDVYGILEKEDAELVERYRPLVDQFKLMKELALILSRRRHRRGAIDFDFPELKVKLDDHGKPLEIVPRRRTIAERIIEEFMLVANETVARHFSGKAGKFVYRVHEKPSADKIIELNRFLHNLGHRIKDKEGVVEPKAVQQMLAQAEDKPHQRLVNTVTLRSMKQARYAAENAGHFGLAADYYTHFTSPIRRYPDLLVHRFITYSIAEQPPKKWQGQQRKLEEIAEHCSRRERVAEEADRESVDMKKVEYMLGRVGETFDGIISGVTAFGLFVELDNSVEGLVHISNLHDDYYHYDEKQYSLVGENKGKTYRLADAVKVELVKVNKDERTLDFLLAKEK